MKLDEKTIEKKYIYKGRIINAAPTPPNCPTASRLCARWWSIPAE